MYWPDVPKLGVKSFQYKLFSISPNMNYTHIKLKLYIKRFNDTDRLYQKCPLGAFFAVLLSYANLLTKYRSALIMQINLIFKSLASLY